MSASRRTREQPLVADDEADTGRREGLLGGRVVADTDDLLVAQPQLLDRPQPEVVEAADDDVTG